MGGSPLQTNKIQDWKVTDHTAWLKMQEMKHEYGKAYFQVPYFSVVRFQSTQ